MSPAMTIARKRGRKPTLRTLDAAQLQTVAGGLIIDGSSATSDTTVPSGISQAVIIWSTP